MHSNLLHRQLQHNTKYQHNILGVLFNVNITFPEYSFDMSIAFPEYSFDISIAFPEYSLI